VFVCRYPYCPHGAFASNFHELEVSLAEDGQVSVVPPEGADVLRVEGCVSHSRSEETGFDIAVCELEQAAAIPWPRLAQATPGVDQEVTLIGYGFDSIDGTAGRKRAVSARIDGISEAAAGGELIIGGPEAGSCRGDSGGPAFVPANEQSGYVTLVGILSGGEFGGCGAGWYVDVARDWPSIPAAAPMQRNS
jgi:Trypsin